MLSWNGQVNNLWSTELLLTHTQRGEFIVFTRLRCSSMQIVKFKEQLKIKFFRSIPFFASIPSLLQLFIGVSMKKGYNDWLVYLEDASECVAQ